MVTACEMLIRTIHSFFVLLLPQNLKLGNGIQDLAPARGALDAD
jgi:hypothetical protein